MQITTLAPTALAVAVTGDRSAGWPPSPPSSRPGTPSCASRRSSLRARPFRSHGPRCTPTSPWSPRPPSTRPHRRCGAGYIRALAVNLVLNGGMVVAVLQPAQARRLGRHRRAARRQQRRPDPPGRRGAWRQGRAAGSVPAVVRLRHRAVHQYLGAQSALSGRKTCHSSIPGAPVVYRCSTQPREFAC